MLDTKGEKGKELKRETESALERIHAAGVLQGDIKWRNIMVLDNNELEYRDASRERLGRIVWLDFSNAVTREEGIGEDLWGPKVNEETRRLRDMLDRHEVCNFPHITRFLWLVKSFLNANLLACLSSGF